MAAALLQLATDRRFPGAGDAVGLTLGDTIHNWDTAGNPTALPEIVELLPGTANRVFMPAVLRGE